MEQSAANVYSTAYRIGLWQLPYLTYVLSGSTFAVSYKMRPRTDINISVSVTLVTAKFVVLNPFDITILAIFRFNKFADVAVVLRSLSINSLVACGHPQSQLT